MIKVDKYNLHYDTSHMLKPKPKVYKEIVDRLTSLECKLFYNIVSSPSSRYETNYSEGRIQDHYKEMSPEERFQNIFNEAKLYANPKSFFVNKTKCLPKDCNEIKSVSFALSDYKDLHKHFDARGSEYGICFFHDFLQNKGLRPVEYINQNNRDIVRSLLFNSPHLLEVYSNKYDMRWECEWRLNEDLNFTEDDIAFVIVPTEKHDYYLDWFMDKDGFENIQIISSNAYISFVDYLIQYPQQGDNSWNQIEIFRDPNGSGLKISPEHFNDIDETSKSKFATHNKNELECFIKNNILMKYEYPYTSKFLDFSGKINNINNTPWLFKDYPLISENHSEPDDSDRNLVIGLFETLYSYNPYQ